MRMQCSERQGDAVGGEVAAPRALHVAGQGLEWRLASGCVLANEAQEGNLRVAKSLSIRLNTTQGMPSRR